MFQQDYIMRQIEMLASAIARAFFHRETIEYAFPEDRILWTDADRWYRRILMLLEEKRLNDAENLLFEGLDPENRSTLAAALDFYRHLSALAPAQLDQMNFSAEEIQQGLCDAARIFGLDLSSVQNHSL